MGPEMVFFKVKKMGHLIKEIIIVLFGLSSISHVLSYLLQLQLYAFNITSPLQ